MLISSYLILPVLGSLLVVANVSHVSVDLVSSSENVVNYFAKVSIKICCGHLLQFVLSKVLFFSIFFANSFTFGLEKFSFQKYLYQYFYLNISGNVPLPFQFPLSFLDHDGDLSVVFHEVREGLAQFDVFLGCVRFGRLDVIEVSSEDYQHVVLGDVVLDLGLEESLKRDNSPEIVGCSHSPERRRP